MNKQKELFNEKFNWKLKTTFKVIFKRLNFKPYEFNKFYQKLLKVV